MEDNEELNIKSYCPGCGERIFPFLDMCPKCESDFKRLSYAQLQIENKRLKHQLDNLSPINTDFFVIISGRGQFAFNKKIVFSKEQAELEKKTADAIEWFEHTGKKLYIWTNSFHDNWTKVNSD